MVIICIATAALLMLVGQATYTLTPRGAFVLAVAGQIPVIPAVAIQATLHPGLQQQEDMAARSPRPWRFAHIAVLTGVATACIVAAVSIIETFSDGSDAASGLALVRNLLALSGAALVGASLIGRSFAWVIPLGWIVVPYLFIPRPGDDPIGIFTLTSQEGNAVVPLIFTGFIWTLGVALAVNDVRAILDRRGDGEE